MVKFSNSVSSISRKLQGYKLQGSAHIKEVKMDINEDKLNELLGKFVGDLGATMHAGSIVIGEKLGLYKAMATPEERVTADELANRTGTNERYVREWLNAQAASGYVQYDPDADSYYM